MTTQKTNDRAMTVLWHKVQRDGAASLDDESLADLHYWLDAQECSLPPAQWVRDELVERGMLDEFGVVSFR